MLPQRESGHAEKAARDIQSHLQEFIEFLNKLGQSAIVATKRQLDSRQGLRITKGNRNKVVYGQTARGFRNELTNKDVQTLQDLIKQNPVAQDGEEPSGASNYEIKYHGKTLFRQELGGEVTVNEAPLLGFVKHIEPGVVTLDDYKEAFAPLEDDSSSDSDDDLKDNQEEQNLGEKQEVQSDVTSEKVTPQSGVDLSVTEETEKRYKEDYDPSYDDEPNFTGISSEQKQDNNQEQKADIQNSASVKKVLDDPWLDTDGDGLTDKEEFSFGTDPLSPDSDQDGLTDLEELQNGTSPEVFNQTEVEESDSLLDRDHLYNATQVVQQQLSRIDERQITVKEALTTLVNKSQVFLKNASQFTLDRINPFSPHNQQKMAAQTAMKLLKDNFEKTGATKYEAVDYNIVQKGYNKYEVTDKAGAIKLSFQNNFTGIDINESNFSIQDYQTFAAVSKTLKNTQGTVLNAGSENQLNSFKGLAKEEDRQQYLDIQGQEVVKIAHDFLHYAGTKMWDREGSNYRIASDKKTFLTIEAKDGRGTILSYSKDSFKQNLSLQDIKHFQKLDINVKALVAQKQQRISQQQSFTPEVKTRNPTINKEQELSL